MEIVKQKILINVARKSSISRRDISQKIRHPIEERDKHLAQLEKEGFIEKKIVMVDGVKKSPTYYYITAKGKRWYSDYISSLPNDYKTKEKRKAAK